CALAVDLDQWKQCDDKAELLAAMCAELRVARTPWRAQECPPRAAGRAPADARHCSARGGGHPCLWLRRWHSRAPAADRLRGRRGEGDPAAGYAADGRP